MKFRKYLSVLMILGLMSLCACQDIPNLEGFDQAIWKNDKLGCTSEREKYIPVILKNKERLIGLGQNQILALLGKPDFSELYQRGQRYYIYYYAKDKPCKDETPDIHQDKKVLKIRFSALDAITEIVVNE